MATREEHLAWCKMRALEYVEAGELFDAFASMCSDLSKHPETVDHPGAELGMIAVMGGLPLLKDAGAMRRFINGFN